MADVRVRAADEQPGVESPNGHEPHSGRPPRKRRFALVGALGALVLGAGAVAVLADGGGDDTEPQSASQATKTTTIRQQDLVEREEVAGTLGFDDSRTVVNQLAGTVTWTPEAGSTVRTNHRLYSVNGTAVYLLDGSYPVYRALGPGLTGSDVRQFERNLRELGLDPGYDMKLDGVWDAGTTAAAKRWQRRKGMEQDGTIEQDRVVFQPGARRIASVELEAGADASGTGASSTATAGAASALMTTTSTRRVVTVDLEADKQDLATEGDEVGLEMPDGDEVAGTVTSVGKVAEKNVTTADEDPPATIEVLIAPDASATGLLDQAPVDVDFEKRRAPDALTVPVTALLARQGGEFAVEVREGAARRVVPVQTGMYTDNFVEIEGDGLRPGMTVTDAGV